MWDLPKWDSRTEVISPPARCLTAKANMTGRYLVATRKFNEDREALQQVRPVLCLYFQFSWRSVFNTINFRVWLLRILHLEEDEFNGLPAPKLQTIFGID